MRRVILLLVLLVLACYGGPVRAQEMSGGILFSRFRQFRIPFQAGAGGQRLKLLKLFVSTDLGRTWEAKATAPPEQQHFRFFTDSDGYYWFTVQSQDQDGRLFPPNLEGAQASLKVVVDTQPPTVTLQPLAGRNGEVGVTWDVRDDNLDLALPDALRLEYRAAGGVNWIPLSVSSLVRQHYWNPLSQAPVEVRLKVRDRAGNTNDATTTASLTGGSGNFVPANPPPGSGDFAPVPSGPLEIFNPPTDQERRLVNSKRINLNYELKEVGPSGVSSVELWFTLDGRSWNKYPLRFGEDPNQRNINFDVAGEGLYGLSLVAKSGVGLGDRPPQIGDRPQIWIEVDTTKPVVQLLNVSVGQGLEKGKVTVTWAARDKNLHREPMTLSYAQQPTGPWIPIAQKLPNTGRYVWTLPESIPYQFHIKVEALDLASNIGEAATQELVKVDLSLPKVRIVTVEPGGN